MLHGDAQWYPYALTRLPHSMRTSALEAAG